MSRRSARLAQMMGDAEMEDLGLGYGHAGASWVLLGPDVVLRRTPYDADKAAGTLLASGELPGIDDVVANVRCPESDAVALEAFTDTVRRQQARLQRRHRSDSPS
jgi:hypothetical protein